jgi:hypothetical protein
MSDENLENFMITFSNDVRITLNSVTDIDGQYLAKLHDDWSIS